MLRLKNDFATCLNIQVPAQKLNMLNVFVAKQVLCDVINWLHLDKEHSSSALVVIDHDLWRCTAKFRLWKSWIMHSCVHFVELCRKSPVMCKVTCMPYHMIVAVSLQSAQLDSAFPSYPSSVQRQSKVFNWLHMFRLSFRLSRVIS